MGELLWEGMKMNPCGQDKKSLAVGGDLWTRELQVQDEHRTCYKTPRIEAGITMDSDDQF